MCIFWFLLHRYITVHRSKNVKCVTTLYFWIHFRQPFCVRFLHGAAYFRQLLVPWIISTGSGAHPASCTVGTGSFPGVKSGRGVTLTPHPLLLPWSWKGRAIPLLPLWAVRPVQSFSASTLRFYLGAQLLRLPCSYWVLVRVVNRSGRSANSSLSTDVYVNLYPTAFPYGNGMVLHFYQQQESSTTKTVHKVINRGLKTYV